MMKSNYRRRVAVAEDVAPLAAAVVLLLLLLVALRSARADFAVAARARMVNRLYCSV